MKLRVSSASRVPCPPANIATFIATRPGHSPPWPLRRRYGTAGDSGTGQLQGRAQNYWLNCFTTKP
jgi:hypothetical protein